MRCSDCGRTIRPVVAIDIDGTLGDYHNHFLSFAEDWLGYDPDENMEQYDGSIPFSTWCMGAYMIELETYRQIKLAYRQGGMKRTMPIRPGAVELCETAKGMSAELWMTTTRPYLSLDNVVPDTVEWLRRHGIEYDGLLFDELKYAQLAERVEPSRVIMILDDLAEMCEAAEELFPGKVFQAATPYNVMDPAAITTTLDAALEIMVAQIQHWRVPIG
jgi:phosphoglycolate phosphatase-like HAD superfamily hydrolase